MAGQSARSQRFCVPNRSGASSKLQKQSDHPPKGSAHGPTRSITPGAALFRGHHFSNGRTIIIHEAGGIHHGDQSWQHSKRHPPQLLRLPKHNRRNLATSAPCWFTKIYVTEPSRSKASTISHTRQVAAEMRLYYPGHQTAPII